MIGSISQLDGKVLFGRIVAVRDVDADGIGENPGYDVEIYFPDQPPSRADGVIPTGGRPWSKQGVDTQAASVGDTCWASMKDGRWMLHITEWAAICEEDCGCGGGG